MGQHATPTPQVTFVTATFSELQDAFEKAYRAGKADAIEDEVFDVAKAARFLDTSTDTVRKLADAGEIPCRNIGLGTTKQYRFTKSALLAWAGKRGD